MKYAVTIGTVCFLILSGYVFFPHLLGAAEAVSLNMYPDAHKAYLYGERHFDARHSTVYHIRWAEYFFEEARVLNPEHPHVNHQLARIAFLEGDFERALELINAEFEAQKEKTDLSSYYVRALIAGYAGDYSSAIKDYQYFLQKNPRSWAAINDYVWVLLKAGRSQEAADSALYGLQLFPENPWLHNSAAISLYEIGSYESAYEHVVKARDGVSAISKHEWLGAYPGNDPSSAREGIDTLIGSIQLNMHTIELARAANKVE